MAAGLKPHLKLLRVLLQQLADSGYTIWLLGMPPGGGEPFAASRSVLLRGGEGSASTAELVAVWLAQLGLPPAAGGALPRPELGGTQVVAAAVEYGAPPPPVIRPSAASATVQREVLRSLGYLR